MTMRQTMTPQISTTGHPIQYLIQKSRYEFQQTRDKQSTTFAQAAREYISRTGMYPPPHFDVWYDFARSKKVQLIDEYDTITDLLKPFWGVHPATIRANARGALGAENSHYHALRIRNGKILQPEMIAARAKPVVEMIQPFAHYLPDMDLVINTKDEPSIVTPQDSLARYIRDAQKYRLPLFPRSHFSPRPVDMVDEIPKHYGSNIFDLSAKTAWSVITQSCSVDSPARQPNGSDLVESYSYRGFIHNITAFKEVCSQPSLPYHHGFFDRPATLLYSPTLSPVFSAAKVSTFNDILIPPPVMYSEQIFVENGSDVDWEQKHDQLHWRGGTSTGFATAEGYQRHHRQRFVAGMGDIKTPVSVLQKIHNQWIEQTMSPEEAQPLFDVKFTRISPIATKEAIRLETAQFHIEGEEGQQELWKWKYLLDIDGHGESGRYYALLKSKSLVFKATMFREWHDEILWPWVHYIPLGLDGGDWYESVRYFATEESGKVEGKTIAEESQEWAKKVLRKEDMEVWMFRLLLEYSPHCLYGGLTFRYARVIDDHRGDLGFLE
jgi:Glycosyl transferase family 90